jgi:hypothetical protein
MATLKSSIERIRKMNAQLAELVRSARADIAAVEKRDELTTEAKAAAVAARRGQLQEEVKQCKTVGKNALEAIRGKAPSREPLDPAEVARLWERYRFRLDKGENPLRIAQDLTERGEAAGLRVLAEELPDWLRATAPEGQTQSERDAPLAAIRELETPFLTAEETEHRAATEEAQAAANMLELNTGLIAKDGETYEQIFADDPSQNIDLREDA